MGAAAPWPSALEGHEPFQQLLGYMRAMVFEYDAEGRSVRVSPSVSKLLGYQPAEMIGKTSASFVHPDDAVALARGWRVVSQEPEQRTVRYRARHKSGHWVWLETSAVGRFTAPDGTMHGVAFSRDITEQKRAEDELREREERYRIVLEAAGAVVLECDPAGRVAFATPNFGQMLGRTAAEMASTESYSLVHPEDAASARERFREAVESRAPTRLPPYRVRHVDGSWRWAQSTGVAYETSTGELVFLNITRDVSEVVEITRNRIEQVVRTQDAKRLESLGVMAGGMAHDFNNLLTPIICDADLALSELAADSPLRPRLERIQRTAQRAAELTRHMLAYAGAEEIEAEPLELSSLVEETSQLLETALAGRAVPTFELGRDLPCVLGDRSQLTQVVMNLLTNAAEALEQPGGEVAVRTGMLEVTADAVVLSPDGPVERGRYVFVEVEDRGCGMDAETQGRIFDPFFTTKFTGRGLGLASVLGILRAHRGAIEIDSEPGRGTRIRVLLPATDEQPASSRRSRRDAGSSEGGGAMILVSDDDEGTREVISESLKRAGLRALSASNGEAGVALFREHADEVELVLLDCTMPGLSCDATYDRIREIRGEVKLLLMSGFAEKRAAESFAGRELAGFIGKPFLPDELVDRVRSALTGADPASGAAEG